MSFEIKYIKKSWQAHEPKMATSGSAVCDFFAAEEKKLKPHSATPVSVHIQMEIEPGYYDLILPRSGLACHHFLDIGGGIIDSDF